MLNKEICKKCFNERYTIVGWNRYDEKRWENNRILCPCGADITLEYPPKECPYKLEQTVMNQNVK